MLLLPPEPVLRQIDAMRDRAHARHGLQAALVLADRDVLYIGVIAVKFAQLGLHRMMDRVDEGPCREPGVHQPRQVVQVDHVAAFHCIAYRPGGVIDVLQVVVDFARYWPARLVVKPTPLHRHSRFAVGVHDRVHAELLQACCQLPKE